MSREVQEDQARWAANFSGGEPGEIDARRKVDMEHASCYVKVGQDASCYVKVGQDVPREEASQASEACGVKRCRHRGRSRVDMGQIGGTQGNVSGDTDTK